MLTRQHVGLASGWYGNDMGLGLGLGEGREQSRERWLYSKDLAPESYGGSNPGDQACEDLAACAVGAPGAAASRQLPGTCYVILGSLLASARVCVVILRSFLVPDRIIG